MNICSFLCFYFIFFLLKLHQLLSEKLSRAGSNAAVKESIVQAHLLVNEAVGFQNLYLMTYLLPILRTHKPPIFYSFMLSGQSTTHCPEQPLYLWSSEDGQSL